MALALPKLLVDITQLNYSKFKSYLKNIVFAISLIY